MQQQDARRAVAVLGVHAVKDGRAVAVVGDDRQHRSRLEARAQAAEDGVELVVVSDHGHSPTIFHSMDTQHRHGPPGILLLHGGPVRAGRLPADAGVLDVYPTLLYLLGIAVPADAGGRVLTAALDPAYVEEHPETGVSSWDGIPLPRSAAPPDAERRRQELEKLHSLGYIR